MGQMFSSAKVKITLDRVKQKRKTLLSKAIAIGEKQQKTV